jgi:uncharacterized membrane protein YidH (DUF202 family)
MFLLDLSTFLALADSCIAVHCIDIDFLLLLTFTLITVDLPILPRHRRPSLGKVKFTYTYTSTSTYTSVVAVMFLTAVLLVLG